MAGAIRACCKLNNTFSNIEYDVRINNRLFHTLLSVSRQLRFGIYARSIESLIPWAFAFSSLKYP